MILAFLSCTTNQFYDPTLALPDVNATSSTFGQNISLGDYENTVSAWYFGHAT